MIVDFVNRTSEIEKLNSIKLNLGKENSIVVVNGISGVGKSILTKKFISSCKEQIPAIKVEITQAEKNAYSTGFYVNKIASAINEIAKKDERLITFEQYLRRNKPSEVVLKKIGDSIKSDFASNIPGGNTIRSIFDFFSGQSDFDENTVFTSTHSESQFLLVEYIISICKRLSLILNIENIQSIDAFSLNQLISIIRESKNCIFLLEYTQDDSSGYSLGEIIGQIEDEKVSCRILNVEPLSLKDIKAIISENPKVSWELIQKSYVEWKGNLRPLIDILVRIKYGIFDEIDNKLNLNSGTIEHLLSLSKSELFLLHIIYCHKEATDLGMLKRLVTFREAFSIIYDIDESIKKLEAKFLIKVKQDGITLEHDSIAIELKKVKEHDIYTLIAHKFWLGTYNDLLNKADVYISKGHILTKILYYALCLNEIDRIYELLELISYEALRSRDPEKMVLYVQKVKEQLNELNFGKKSQRVRHINLWLIELYYKLGKVGQAWSVLEEIEEYSNTEIVLKAILLEQTGKHKEAIEFCNRNIPKANNYDQELALCLVRLVTNYDIGNEKKTIREFNRLINKKEFKKCIEYGFLLRNAELIYTFKESLPYYKKSITVFKKHNALRQTAFSRITYGVHLGLTGQYETARKEFEKASNEIGGVISERHTLFNNLAVLNIFQQIDFHVAEEYLRQAMLTAEGDFERLTIHMNFLVIMDWQNKNIEAEKSIESMNNIIKSRTFASREILLFAYFDIYMYYKERQQDEFAEIYLNKMKDIGIPNIPLWNQWLHNKPMELEDELFYYGVINRAVSFLCNWNMEYDSTLMHY